MYTQKTNCHFLRRFHQFYSYSIEPSILDEARKHRDKAMQLRDDRGPRDEMKEEKRLYSEVKRARWILLV